ncbi:hypothetical protein HYPSUDRAFT_149831 [Hypholoma sublateritium FD-334 SS-4]|uniref:Uncharacterized protein n=1 Tax=Hypholoma sublateritium (strain FD-334 SS-4) TaxID=945553 RepID=A0A0D2KJQ3_HYPSF|nr:hypothetical protein HYPSUDRAFT_149831 [Hypholoma sublateritium FD-334 SS-4]
MQDEERNAAEAAAARARLQLDQSPTPSDREEDQDDLNQDFAPREFSRVDHVRFAQEFIQEISEATYYNGKLDKTTIANLENPLEGPTDIEDPDTRLSLNLFISCGNASEQTYNSVRQDILACFPGTGVLSYHMVKKFVAEITGVYSISDDMCINSCHAFTGPFKDLDQCHVCNEPRFDPIEFACSGKQVPRQQATTIPLGPQLQALRRSKEGANAMCYRDKKTTEIIESFNAAYTVDELVYGDIFSGEDYLDLAEKHSLTEDDTTVMLSIDGAQLYQNKKSDTWIAVWVVLDYDPNTRYRQKHILPAVIIPGPNKAKYIDSLLFRSIHHLSALQRANNGAGLRVWDGIKEETVFSKTMFILGTADAVGLVELDGRVGHHGAHGCRLGSEMKGRHKPNSGHYCAAHLRPNDSPSADSNHADFDFRSDSVGSSRDTPEKYQAKLNLLVSSRDQAEYEQNRKSTGLSKPSILCGLHTERMLIVPLCNTQDLMHLIKINLGDLLLPLWRGTLRCDPTDNKATWDWAILTGDTWIAHGNYVASTTKYFPSSFHRPPRNPAEKINSGYKATEWYLYLFGLGPGLFRTLLPKKYWRHFCKLVHGVKAIMQRKITGKQLREAHSFLCQFVEEFELLYYQWRTDRLHFCRPSLHSLLHICPETHHIGPGAYYTQFTLERCIGNYGQKIRQPATPFANFMQIAVRESQLSALKTIFPVLDTETTASIPQYSHDLGNGFILLRPRTRYAKKLDGQEGIVVGNMTENLVIRKWGRLHLPNGQVARSLFSEERRTAQNKRNSRNVKFCQGEKHEFGEVQFYFMLEDAAGILKAYALISQYGPPDADMLEDSYQQLWACEYRGDQELKVISISDIVSVVSMQPLPPMDGEPGNLWFVVEKSGLDDIILTGYVDDL